MSKPNIIQPISMTNHIFIGLHGDPGIGKTRLIGTSPGKTLLIRAAQSHLDSLLPADKARAAKGEIEQAVVADYDDLMEVQAYLRAEGEQFNWVWMDDIQTVYDAMLDDLWDTVLIEKPARARYGLDKSEYGIVMERLSRWVRHTVGPDKFNFGFTAHSEVGPSPDKDADGDPIEKLIPWIQGKGMPNKIMGYTNVVAYYHKAKIGGKEGRRVLRTESSEAYYAKDQFDAFDGRIVDPSVKKIEDLITKAPGRTTAPADTTKRTATRRRVTKKR